RGRAGRGRAGGAVGSFKVYCERVAHNIHPIAHHSATVGGIGAIEINIALGEDDAVVAAIIAIQLHTLTTSIRRVEQKTAAVSLQLMGATPDFDSLLRNDRHVAAEVVCCDFDLVRYIVEAI